MKTSARFTGLFTRTMMLIGTALLGTGCSQSDLIEPSARATADNYAKSDKIFYGPAKPLGQGVGRAWVMINASGAPISMGVNLSAKALLNQGTRGTHYTFELPRQVNVPPFDHIEMEWNPQGHDPQHVYDIPHFDMHFYMITSAYQSTIPFLAPPAFDTAPAAKYLPAAYIQTPGLVPNMGAHWVDVLSSEFQSGGTFTKTLIYGTYSSEVIFLEPMFTHAYLSTRQSATFSIRQPESFQKAGYYPTHYSILYNTSPQEYTLSLNNLTYRPAG